MMDVLTWVEETRLATAISQSLWLFPTIETVHVLALAMVIGSIVLVDLRLVGVRDRDRPITRILTEMTPWTWAGFCVAALSGSLLFASAATRYVDNVFFLVKLAALALAGLNMAFFHFTLRRHPQRFEDEQRTPFSARMAGALSMTLWTAVVALGRWIGFV